MAHLFDPALKRIDQLFQQLDQSDLKPYIDTKFPKSAGVYLFYENSTPVRVGRSKNIKQRIKSHTTKNPSSASFAVKLTRKETGKNATYKREGSIKELMKDDNFKGVFYQNIARIKKMQIKYVETDDSIEQYLLELYVALHHKFELSEFDTH